MRLSRWSLLSLTACALLLSGPVLAEPREGGDRLRIEAGEHVGVDAPTRGMNMDNVRDVFGQPRDRRGPVGDPPITRWDYDGFSVYFEHNLVLHSVVHGRIPDAARD